MVIHCGKLYKTIPSWLCQKLPPGAGRAMPATNELQPSLRWFHLTEDNTSRHFQVAEVNGSAGKWSTSKPGKELNTAVENTAQGGDRSSKHMALTGLWKLGHHRFWEHLVCVKPSGFTSAGNPSASCLLSSLWCRVLPLPCVIDQDHFDVLFPLLAQSYHFLNASQMFFKPKTCNHKFLKAGKWSSLKKTLPFFKQWQDSQDQENTEARTLMGIYRSEKEKSKYFLLLQHLTSWCITALYNPVIFPMHLQGLQILCQSERCKTWETQRGCFFTL